MTMKKTLLRRVDVFSAAKIMAIIYAIIGLIYGVIFMIFMMFVGLAAISYPNSYSPAGAGGAFLGGIFILILTPIFAAIGGFIAGALFAFIYNLAVGWIGPLEMEMDIPDGGNVRDAPGLPPI
jgi:hypothetical protein